MVDKRRYIVWAILLGVMILSVALKSQYYLSKPYLPDGDSYFHGMLTNYIVDRHELTSTVPYQVPPVGHGYPFGFHILAAQIHYLTGWSVLSIIRWFGAVMSAIVVAAVFIVTRRVTRSSAGALMAAILTLFIPLLAGRLGNTFPENILVFFIPVLLWLLIMANIEQDRYGLIVGGMIVISAVGFHFTSYLLIPAYFIGVFVYFIGRRWRKRNIFYIGGIGFATLLAVSIVYSNWWLFGFLKSFVASNSGTALEISSTPHALPAPDSNQWYAHLGYLPVVIGGLGAVLLAWQRTLSWRVKLVLAAYIFTVLLPLQILPALKLFSYTPFRAFVYLGIPLAILAGGAVSWLVRQPKKLVPLVVSVVLLISVIPNQNVAATAGAGEQHLTTAEFTGGVSWLIKHTSPDSITITAPANGRQIAFFTMQTTAYDTSSGTFYAKTSSASIKAIRELGPYSIAYIYVSKYKLGPVYNFGWVRDYAYVNADLKKFKDGRYFTTVFEDDDSIIFQANPDLLTLTARTPAGA